MYVHCTCPLRTLFLKCVERTIHISGQRNYDYAKIVKFGRTYPETNKSVRTHTVRSEYAWAVLCAYACMRVSILSQFVVFEKAKWEILDHEKYKQTENEKGLIAAHCSLSVRFFAIEPVAYSFVQFAGRYRPASFFITKRFQPPSELTASTIFALLVSFGLELNWMLVGWR